MLHKTVALIAFGMFLSLQTAGASIVYSYISEPLVVQSDDIGIFPTSEPIFVTGEFAVNLPLTPNLPVNDWTSVVTDFEFSFRTASQDGISNVLAFGQASRGTFVFGTDNTGNIDRWGIDLLDYRNDYYVSFATGCYPAICADEWQEHTFPPAGGSSLSSLATNSELPGTWSVVPLPAALPLFTAALLGLGFVARRRRATN